MRVQSEEPSNGFALAFRSGDEVRVDVRRQHSPAGTMTAVVRLTAASVVGGIGATVWMLASEARVLGQRLIDLASTPAQADGAPDSG